MTLFSTGSKKLKNIAVCAYGYVGEQLSSFICNQGFDVKLACTHNDDVFEEKINKIYLDSGINCLRRADLNSEKFFKILKNENIDLVFLLWWPQIIKKRAIGAVNLGFVNLHPSFLPYNRGKHPYYWSIIDDTPAGISIHYISPGIDDGDIIFQEKIETNITTSGEALYSESVDRMIDLFKSKFSELVSGDFITMKQPKNTGSFHLSKDLDKHSRIDLDKNYRAMDLINILRARSFSNGPSSFFYLDGKKYCIKVKIEEVDR